MFVCGAIPLRGNRAHLRLLTTVGYTTHEPTNQLGVLMPRLRPAWDDGASAERVLDGNRQGQSPAWQHDDNANSGRWLRRGAHATSRPLTLYALGEARTAALSQSFNVNVNPVYPLWQLENACGVNRKRFHL